ncbi:unnamed protein product [Gadus morhua 'NCC']
MEQREKKKKKKKKKKRNAVALIDLHFTTWQPGALGRWQVVVRASGRGPLKSHLGGGHTHTAITVEAVLGRS